MIKCFPLARCRFWIVTCCFLLVPATCSIILCVCVWCGVVYILDRNMVFSLGVGSIFNYLVHVRMVRCAFWSVTRWFLVAAAYSVILRLCVVLLFCFSARLLDIVNRIGLAASKLRYSGSSADFLRFGAGDFPKKQHF